MKSRTFCLHSEVHQCSAMNQSQYSLVVNAVLWLIICIGTLRNGHQIDSWLKSFVLLFTTNKTERYYPYCSLLRLFSQNCNAFCCWHLYLTNNEHCSIHMSVCFDLPMWSTQDNILFHPKSGIQSYSELIWSCDTQHTAWISI